MSKVNVRYIVNDVDAVIPFYTEMLGFKVEMHPAPGFASLSRGDLQLLLNRPGAGGAGQAMRDGQSPGPGGWNRIQIEVEDIEATVNKLKNSGGRFRNDIITGNGGKQILIEDPSGNPIELFQPFLLSAPVASEASCIRLIAFSAATPCKRSTCCLTRVTKRQWARACRRDWMARETFCVLRSKTALAGTSR
jgi:predicted enzyme related to lactoylglutathione lyase